MENREKETVRERDAPAHVAIGATCSVNVSMGSDSNEETCIWVIQEYTSMPADSAGYCMPGFSRVEFAKRHGETGTDRNFLTTRRELQDTSRNN